MSVLSNRELLKSSLFPAAMPPVAAVLAGLMVQILGTGILIAVLTWRGSVSVSLTAMPLIVLFQALFTIGTVWILSCVNILYRDTSPVLTHTLTLLMFLSPIAYTSQMVPDNLAIIVRLNPLAYLIDGYRTILLEQQFPSVGTLATFGILAVFVLEAGHRYFNRLRGLLSDHV
jgi:ABC-type polysaccharide/polyol phosphate export permease